MQLIYSNYLFKTEKVMKKSIILILMLVFLSLGCEDTYVAGYNGKLETNNYDESIYTEQDSLNLGLKK
tara:strand:- start:94 stop:297 length:204 start_codon:yes stop_codon:yes gene_type:complete